MHIKHKWSLWVTAEVEYEFPPGSKGTVQARKCEKCGFIQTKPFN